MVKLKKLVILAVAFIFVFGITFSWNYTAHAYAPGSAPQVYFPSNGALLDKGDIAVSWSNVPGTSYYVIAALDTTSNTKIIYDVNVGTSTSYIISSNLLTEKHKFKIAVAAIGDGVEKWNNSTYITIKESIGVPTASGVPSLLTVDKGSKINLQGTINCTSNMEKISVSVAGWYGGTDGAGKLLTKSISSKSYNLNNFTIDSNSQAFPSAGFYTLNVWAKPAGGDAVQVTSITLEIKAVTIIPIAKDLPSSLSVDKGKTVKLSGTVSCTANIETISVSVQGWYGGSDGAGKLLSNNPNSKSYYLSNFTIDSNSPAFPNPGIYTINIWAKPAGSDAIQVGSIILEIKNVIIVPTLSDIPSTLSVNKGSAIYLSGKISCTANMEAVSVSVSGWNGGMDGAGKLLTSSPNSKYFYLNSFKIDTNSPAFPTPGSYILNIWVKPTGTEALQAASIILEVKAVIPSLSGIPASISVDKGKTVKLSGMISCDVNIETLSISVSDWYGGMDGAGKLVSVNPNSKTYSLSNINIDTNSPAFPKSGSYTLNIWVKPIAGDALQIGSLTLNINEVLPPDTLNLFPGEVKKFSGSLNMSGKIRNIRAVVQRIGDFTYTGTLYSKLNLNSSTFDCNNISFAATGQYLSVPGKYEVKILVVFQNNSKEAEVLKYTVNVIDPVALKEVRYLPLSDEIYLRADINELVGQKKDSEWPIVWAGIYDLDSGKWLYLNPDNNSKLTHVGFNKYEMYFPAEKVSRNRNLKFMFFVDGYANSAGVKYSKDLTIKINPIPSNTWSAQYNWVTDEIEVSVKPDVYGDTKLDNLNYYAVIYADDYNQPLYVNFDKYTEIPKYGGNDKRYQGIYFRSWKLTDLNLSRDKTYKIAVKAKGYEAQWDMNLLRSISIYPPEFKNLSISYSSDSKKISINGTCKGLTGKNKIAIRCETKALAVIVPRVVEYSSSSSFNKEILLKDMGLSENSTYNFTLSIMDEGGNEIRGTAKSLQVKTTSLQQPSISQSDFYLEYGKMNKYFDMTKDQRYTFTERQRAVEDIMDPYAWEYKIYKNFKDFMKNWSWPKDGIDEERWNTKDYYKKEIIKMITLNSEDTKMKICKETQKGVDVFRKLTSYDIKIEKAFYEMDITSVRNFLEKAKSYNLSSKVDINSYSKDIQSALNELKQCENLLKGTKLLNKSLKYAIIASSDYEVKEEILNSLEKVATVQGNDQLRAAISEVREIHNNGKNGFVMDNLKTQALNDMFGFIYDKTLGKGITYIAKANVIVAGLTIFDTALELSLQLLGYDERMDNVYSSITDGFIQFYAGLAYDMFNRRGDSEGIKAAGLVYLSAAKQGNTNYAKFLECLDKDTYRADIENCMNKIPNIDKLMDLWSEGL